MFIRGINEFINFENVQDFDVDACFFENFAFQGFRKALAKLHTSARQDPQPAIRLLVSFPKKDWIAAPD